jgi:DNA-binding response OmpR family regulator
MMATMIAVVTDLIFSTKITGTGKALGKPVLVARTIERLREHLAAAEAADSRTVIVDLNVSGVDPLAVIREAKAGGAKVVAFLSHVQADLAAAAREAGADQVMARSGFTERLPEILGGG